MLSLQNILGGLALGLWGVGRSTVDIDILVSRDDTGKVDNIMTGLGYECRLRSENASQYLSPLKVFGEVDFLHAFREASLEMLKNAEEKTAFNNTLKIKVVRPEDKAAKELLELSKSDSLKKDMQTVALQRHNPFFKDGKPDIDAYIEFVFVGHGDCPYSTTVPILRLRP
ncbi:MAG: hypothetical protein HY957_08230 [Nitrospirae bacterium]|nr:hypothetical protein [Nitrospirota bacterium]